MCNQHSQLKIEAFDDYFGFRTLIDDFSIWMLLEISDELVYSGVRLQGDAEDEKLEETLTWYSQHVEYEGVASALRPLLVQPRRAAQHPRRVRAADAVTLSQWRRNV